MWSRCMTCDAILASFGACIAFDHQCMAKAVKCFTFQHVLGLSVQVLSGHTWKLERAFLDTLYVLLGPCCCACTALLTCMRQAIICFFASISGNAWKFQPSLTTPVHEGDWCVVLWMWACCQTLGIARDMCHFDERCVPSFAQNSGA